MTCFWSDCPKGQTIGIPPSLQNRLTDSLRNWLLRNVYLVKCSLSFAGIVTYHSVVRFSGRSPMTLTRLKNILVVKNQFGLRLSAILCFLFFFGTCFSLYVTSFGNGIALSALDCGLLGGRDSVLFVQFYVPLAVATCIAYSKHSVETEQVEPVRFLPKLH